MIPDSGGTEHESEPESDPVRSGRCRFAGVSRDGEESAVANCSERCGWVRSPRQRRRLLFAVPPNSTVRQESRFPERQQRLGSMLAGAAITAGAAVAQIQTAAAAYRTGLADHAVMMQRAGAFVDHIAGKVEAARTNGAMSGPEGFNARYKQYRLARQREGRAAMRYPTAVER